jgi:DNA invertase Pin-like site-specific DNA recombinase
MFIGYARVSTKDQHLRMQLDDLQGAGCEKVYTEVASGSKNDRPVLAELLAFIQEGDVLVIWKLDRLGRSLRHLVEVVGALLDKGVGFKSLNDPIDTTTAQGRLIFNIFASLAEFERELIRERTKAGLRAAKVRGNLAGRPKGLSRSAEKTSYAAAALYQEGTLSSREICKRLGIARSTFYEYLRIRGVELGGKKGSRLKGVEGNEET